MCKVFVIFAVYSYFQMTSNNIDKEIIDIANGSYRIMKGVIRFALVFVAIAVIIAIFRGWK